MNSWMVAAFRGVLNARFKASWAVPAWTNWLGFIVAAVFSVIWANDHRMLVWLLEQELVSESATRTLPRTIRYLSLAGVLLGLIGSFRVFFWPLKQIATTPVVRRTSAGVWSFFSPHLAPLWHAATVLARTLWRWSTEFGRALSLNFRRFGCIARSGFDHSRAGTLVVFGKLATAAGTVALIVGAVAGRLWFGISVVFAYVWLSVTTVLAVIGYGLRVVGSDLARGIKWCNDVSRQGVTKGIDTIASGLARARIGLKSGYAVLVWLLESLIRLLTSLLVGLFAGAVTVLFTLGPIAWAPIRFVGGVAYLATGIVTSRLRALGIRIYSLLLRFADNSTDALGWALRQAGTGLATGYRVGAIPISYAIGALVVVTRAASRGISLMAITAYSRLVVAGLFAVSVAGVAFNYLGRALLILAMLALVVTGALVSAVIATFRFLRRGAAESAYLGKLALAWIIAVVSSASRYALAHINSIAGYLAIGFRAAVQLVAAGLNLVRGRAVRWIQFAWGIVLSVNAYLLRGLRTTADVVGSGLRILRSGLVAAIVFVLYSLSPVVEVVLRVGLVAALLALTMIGLGVMAVTGTSLAVWRGLSASAFAIAMPARLLWLGVVTAFRFAWAGLALAWAITANSLIYVGSAIALLTGYAGRGLHAIGRIIRTGAVFTASVANIAMKRFGATLSAGHAQLRRSFIAVVSPVARSTSHGGAVMFRQIRVVLLALIGMVGLGAAVVLRTLDSMGGEAWFLITSGTGYLWNGAAATGSYASAGTASIGRTLASGGATPVGVVGRIVTPALRVIGMVSGYLGIGAVATFQLVPRPGLIVPLVVLVAVTGGGYYGWGAIDGNDFDDTLVVAHWATGHLIRDGLLKEMAAQFNQAGHVTSSGERFIVRVYDVPSELQGEYLSELLTNGTRRNLNAETNGYVVADIPDPTIVTPSSAHWLVSTNYEVGQAGMPPVVDLGAAESIVKPVIGIVTYEVMARCLGWPNVPIGFEEIIALRDDPLGWGGYTCANGTLPDPKWGQRPLLAFTDPTTSSTGRSLHLALYAFAADKDPGDLDVADVTDPHVVGYVKDFQSLIDHYLIGTTVLNTKIFQGKEYGHFFVMPEDNLIHLYEGTEESFFNGVASTAPPIKERMVMIYPKEGSMPRNNCACIVQAEWVTPEHVDASHQWIDFIRQEPQQKAFMGAGFRPGIDIPLDFEGSKITGEFGLDPAEPKVVVNPSLTRPEVAAAIDDTWDDVKRPGIVTFVADTSGSMLVSGKLGEAKDGMKRAVTAMAPNNRVGLVTFNDDVSTEIEIALLSENRDALRSAVQGLTAVGETALYDAVKRGVEMTDRAVGDESAIRAVVVLTDGRANAGDTGLDDLIYMSDSNERLVPVFAGFDGDSPPRGVDRLALVTGIGLAVETKHRIQIFFIGIGADADMEIGRMLAEATGGEFQKSSEEDLAETLEEFSAYF